MTIPATMPIAEAIVPVVAMAGTILMSRVSRQASRVAVSGQQVMALSPLTPVSEAKAINAVAQGGSYFFRYDKETLEIVMIMEKRRDMAELFQQ